MAGVGRVLFWKSHWTQHVSQSTGVFTMISTHFTGGKTKTQRKQVTCPGSYARRQQNWTQPQGELILKPRCSPVILDLCALSAAQMTIHLGQVGSWWGPKDFVGPRWPFQLWWQSLHSGLLCRWPWWFRSRPRILSPAGWQEFPIGPTQQEHKVPLHTTFLCWWWQIGQA